MMKMIRELVKFFINNFKAILASLILAFLLWLVITTNKEYRTKIKVPFKISRLAENKALVNPVPEKVVLEISGKGRSLLALNFYQSNIDLELPEIEKSTTLNLDDYMNRFNIASELGVHILGIIEPKKIELKVDQYMEIKKPVRVSNNIETAAGYILMNVTPSEDSVLIKGPASLLSRLNYLETKKIEKKEVKYPFRETIAMVDPRPGIIQLIPNKINVSFLIEQIVERTIYEVPIQIVGVPADLVATPSPASVSLRIKGGESLVTAVTKDEFTVFFDYSRNYVKGNIIYEMQIETPLNISWINVSPDKFRLQLRKVESD